jgi:AAA+ superfamily predicted ATPase
MADLKIKQHQTEFTRQATNLVRAGFQAVVVQTEEPRNAAMILESVATEMDARRQTKKDLATYSFIQWDVHRGFIVKGAAATQQKDLLGEAKYRDPIQALSVLTALPSMIQSAIVVMHNLHAVLDQSVTARQLLQNLIVEQQLSNATFSRPIFFIQSVPTLHPELQHLLQPLPLPHPNQEELGSIVDYVHASFQHGRGDKTKELEPGMRNSISASLRGLSRQQASDALSLAIIEQKGFCPEMMLTIRDQKARLVGSGGVLKYISPNQIPNLDEVCGFDNCIPDIRRRALAYTDGGKEAKLDTPRGIALIGVPGSGKSQFAKIIAGIFQEVCGQAFPSYWVNVGEIFGQYVGQSENRLENVLTKLSAHRGCVAVFDEFEKTMGQSADGGHEVANRVRGRLLNWMQEERNDTFIVVTMNSVAGVAPEFFRRFDETYFTDVPSPNVRREILEVHFAKRGVSIERLEKELGSDKWRSVLDMTENFVGSELEDVVINSRLTAFEHGRHVPTLEMIEEAAAKRGESTIFKSQKDMLDEIRKFCSSFARPATKESRSTRRPSRARNLDTN